MNGKTQFEKGKNQEYCFYYQGLAFLIDLRGKDMDFLSFYLIYQQSFFLVCKDINLSN